MGDLREYFRAYWACGWASYSQGKAVVNAVVAAFGGLALFGLSAYVPSIPAWVAPAWLAAYVSGSILLYWPFRMWREQRATIASLVTPTHPLPDMRIAELFDHLASGVPKSDETPWRAIGRDVLDKLSIGQMVGWGRLRKDGPLVEIEKYYWRGSSWSFYWLIDEHEGDEQYHVWPISAFDGAPRYMDVRVNRASAFKVWPRS